MNDKITSNSEYLKRKSVMRGCMFDNTCSEIIYQFELNHFTIDQFSIPQQAFIVKMGINSRKGKKPVDYHSFSCLCERIFPYASFYFCVCLYHFLSFSSSLVWCSVLYQSFVLQRFFFVLHQLHLYGSSVSLCDDSVRHNANNIAIDQNRHTATN